MAIIRRQIQKATQCTSSSLNEISRMGKFTVQEGGLVVAGLDRRWWRMAVCELGFFVE